MSEAFWNLLTLIKMFIIEFSRRENMCIVVRLWVRFCTTVHSKACIKSRFILLEQATTAQLLSKLLKTSIDKAAC